MALLVGWVVLARSVSEAQTKVDELRFACYRREVNSESREYRLDRFAASDAVSARLAEKAELTDELIRLRQEKDLTPQDRRLREDSLKLRRELAEARLDFARFVRRDAEEGAKQFRIFRPEGDLETQRRAFGC